MNHFAIVFTVPLASQSWPTWGQPWSLYQIGQAGHCPEEQSGRGLEGRRLPVMYLVMNWLGLSLVGGCTKT